MDNFPGLADAPPIRLLLILLILLCDAVRASPLSLPIVLREPKGVEASSIADYQAALDAILPVLSGRLALPIPRYTLEIHAARDEFEAALVSELKMRPETARSTAGFAKAAVGNYKILVNEAAMSGTDWRERVVILAHELGHATQMELCDHRRWLSRQQWLVEGFAEWVAYQVVDALGIEDATRARERMRGDLRALRRAGAIPALHELASLEQWVASHKEHGFSAPYSFSFLIVDFLADRYSFEALVDFFRRFRSQPDAEANFRAAFGVDMEEFEQTLEDYFDALLQ